jgi:hypothetical protein
MACWEPARRAPSAETSEKRELAGTSRPRRGREHRAGERGVALPATPVRLARGNPAPVIHMAMPVLITSRRRPW